MYWHIDTEIISLIVLCALFVYNRKMIPATENALQTRSFLTCLRVGIVVMAVDIAASVTMELSVSAPIYHIVMTLDFSALEITMVFWCRYCLVILYHDDARRRRTITRVLTGSYLVYMVFVVSNAWTGLLYTLDERGAYQRGPLFFLMVALYAVYALALLVLILIRRGRMPVGYPVQVLLLSPLILSLSIITQFTNAGWLMILPGYMISMLLAFLFLQTRRVRANQSLLQTLSAAALTDKLTGLNNRAGMEYRVQMLADGNLGKRCTVVVADIDDLKRINDTLGHPEGDRAIQAMGARLRAHFRATDLVARYGGDEFVAYLIGDATLEQTRRGFKRLLDEIATLRVGAEEPIPIHASIGAASGVVGEDSFEDLCGCADAALYSVKRRGKNGFALYEPGMESAQRGMQDADVG